MPSTPSPIQNHFSFGQKERAEKADHRSKIILEQTTLSIFEFPRAANQKEADLQMVARKRLSDLFEDSELPFEFINVIRSGEEIDAILNEFGYQSVLDSMSSRVRISKLVSPTNRVDE